MLLKDDNNIQNYTEDWPKHYYEIPDIDIRETTLRKMIAFVDSVEQTDSSISNDSLNMYSSSSEYVISSAKDKRRLEILLRRYPAAQKNHPRIDRFTAAWMDLLIDSRIGINFLNKGRVEKDVTRCLKDLLVIDFDTDDILCLEWTNFAEFWIKSCVNDRTYDSTAFGLLRLSDSRLGKKIASEIIAVTYTLPARFGYLEACSPLRDIFKATFLKMIDCGDIYWSEAIHEKS